MNATQGGPVQASLAEAPLHPEVVESLLLTRLETLGVIGFVRGSIAEVQSLLRLLALVIAAVDRLTVDRPTELEIHSPDRGDTAREDVWAVLPAVAVFEQDSSV